MVNESNELAKRCRDEMWANDTACQALDMTIEVSEAGRSVTQFEVRPSMVNGHDICHGGYLFLLADTAFAYACNAYDRVTVAAGASIEFIQPARRGDVLSASAEERSRGGRLGVYDVTIHNQNHELIAVFRGRSYASKQAHLPK